MRYYISFGQKHVHDIGYIVLDKSTLLSYTCDDAELACQYAYRLFGKYWSYIYTEKDYHFFKYYFYIIYYLDGNKLLRI